MPAERRAVARLRIWGEGKLRPVSNADDELQATFSVEGEWPDFEVTFESADGRGRNSDYKQAVELILARLGALGAVLRSIWISSPTVMAKVQKDGLEPHFVPKGFGFPLQLAGIDHGRLRRSIGNAGALINRKVRPDGKKPSGNTTRRMTLALSVQRPAMSADQVELALARGTAELDAGPSLAMETDLSAIDAAIEDWLAALEAEARIEQGNRRWLASETIMFARHPSRRRAGAWDAELGVRASGEPWTVQLNAPAAAAAANGLTSLARASDGRRYLIRQGRLRPNPDSDGEVRGERFRELSGLTPVEVSGGATPTHREWYIVADLDGTPEQIRRQTGAFVQACARARLGSLGIVTPASAPALLASDEKGGSFFLKPVEAQPEKEVRRLQGEVWLALQRVLEAAGIKMIKLRHRAGYEVDGVIHAKPSPILLEIKTGASAADVYEGVGQLMLYSEMLKLADHRRILLLPALPRLTLLRAASACGLEVHSYDLAQTGEGVAVSFSEEFLAACGAAKSGSGRVSPTGHIDRS